MRFRLVLSTLLLGLLFSGCGGGGEQPASPRTLSSSPNRVLPAQGVTCETGGRQGCLPVRTTRVIQGDWSTAELLPVKPEVIFVLNKMRERCATTRFARGLFQLQVLPPGQDPLALRGKELGKKGWSLVEAGKGFTTGQRRPLSWSLYRLTRNTTNKVPLLVRQTRALTAVRIGESLAGTVWLVQEDSALSGAREEDRCDRRSYPPMLDALKRTAGALHLQMGTLAQARAATARAPRMSGVGKSPVVNPTG